MPNGIVNTGANRLPFLERNNMQLMAREFNQHTGLIEEYYYDHTKDRIVIRHIMETDPIINSNKEEFKQFNGVGYGDSNGLHKVASIPLILIEKWKKEHGFDWFNSTDRERRIWLDKPEHAFLKTRPGKLSGTTNRSLSSKVSQ
ncbi:hypothetical protein S1R3Y_000050 [Vibrio phage vB_ValP_VA-RY-3]|nr:hypothetical protein S1R3Y_000050 [Vibrio phage vB_ValP_VA-RY-3]